MHSLALVAILPYFLAASAAILNSPSQLKTLKYDYVIIGGGTAGNVVANRLTENPNVSVLVIEAGTDQTNNTEVQIPFFATSLTPGTPLDWNYTTTPQTGLAGRSIPFARGFALGGSSAVNYMVYNRGSQDDWNNYAKIAGDQSLSWAQMAPYMARNENFSVPVASRDVSGDYLPQAHSTSGLLGTSIPGSFNSMDAPVIATTQQLPEFPYRQDMNGGNPLGVGWTPLAINHGVRSSSNSDFIQKFQSRPNLTILTGARATKILYTSSSKGLPVFRGVKFATGPTSTQYTATANKEIVLAAGAFNTPQLLMLSGIGAKAELSKLNITTYVNLPSVGKNMTDHPLLANVFQINAGDSLQDQGNSTNLPGELAQWNKDHTGVMGDQGFRQLGWFRVPPTDSIFKTYRDPSAGPTSAHYELIFGHTLFPGQDAQPGATYMNLFTNVVSPMARGNVTLLSNSVWDHPAINPNLLGHDYDMSVMLYAIKAAQRFISAPAWKDYIVTQVGAFGNAKTDDELKAYASANGGTVWHPVGTAAVSPKGAPWGVVNPDHTVKNAIGLSIVDASVIPYVPSAHTQGVVYLWAERAADQIKARA